MHELELKSLLQSNFWPHAISDNENDSNENYRIKKSKNIFNTIIQQEIKNYRFLDYGCGDGGTIKIANKKGANISLGYDVQENEGVITDLNLIKKNAPYDIILAFDVIDHVEHITPIEMLCQIKSLLSPLGKIFLRCHPFCSKNGAHMCENKAFAHLIFPKMVFMQNFNSNIVVTNPLLTYYKWIESSKLKITNCRQIREDVDDFFKKDIIFNNLKKTFQHENFLKHEMTLKYIDFTLRCDFG